MGSMTRVDLITEALQLAGNTGLSARALVWLNNWLASAYSGYEWPFLQLRFNAALTAGNSDLNVGDGAVTAEKIQHIRRVVISEPTVDSGFKSEITLHGTNEMEASDDPRWLDATAPGVPSMALVDKNPATMTSYNWRLRFSPIPNKAYRVVITAQIRPANLAADGTIPIYPNDETILHSIYVQALRHQQDERWTNEEQMLKQMMAQDRIRYGKMPGHSTKLGLSRRVFRR